jgi:PleD family two-component response regulator
VRGVRQIFGSCRYDLLPDQVGLSASFGIARIVDAETLVSAMQRADRALYAAKNAGRDCYRIAVD